MAYFPIAFLRVGRFAGRRGEQQQHVKQARASWSRRGKFNVHPLRRNHARAGCDYREDAENRSGGS
jgi:hypothetical protein